MPAPGSALPSLDDDALRAIADGIGGADPCALLPEGDRRRWGLVARTDLYDAWVIAWPPGTGLAIHDHSGSRAAVHVVRGELCERFVDHGGVGMATRHLVAGDLVVLGADHVHEVMNLGRVEAVSVHVYSPPLKDVAFREDAGFEPVDVRAMLALAVDG